MPLPTLLKSWRYNINNKNSGGTLIAWHQSLMFDIKEALLGNGGGWDTVPTGAWTVDHSCDFSTAGTPGDGVDRWAVEGDLRWDRPGDPHSWIVFNTPINGGNAQVLIDLDNAGNVALDAVPKSIHVRISWGGLFTGGTTTNKPTATDEPSEITQGATNGEWAGGIDVAVNTSWHMMMSDDGEELRIFMHRDDVCFSLWAVGVLTSTPSHYSDPMFGSVYSSNNTTSDNTGVSVQNGWLESSGNRFVASSKNTCRAMYLGFSGGVARAGLFNSSVVSGIGDENNQETILGEIILWEHNVAGAKSPLGRIKDLWVATDFRSTGDTYPSDGSRQFHHISENLVVPWNGVIPQNTF